MHPRGTRETYTNSKKLAIRLIESFENVSGVSWGQIVQNLGQPRTFTCIQGRWEPLQFLKSNDYFRFLLETSVFGLEQESPQSRYGDSLNYYSSSAK